MIVKSTSVNFCQLKQNTLHWSAYFRSSRFYTFTLLNFVYLFLHSMYPNNFSIFTSLFVALISNIQYILCIHACSEHVNDIQVGKISTAYSVMRIIFSCYTTDAGAVVIYFLFCSNTTIDNNQMTPDFHSTW